MGQKVEKFFHRVGTLPGQIATTSIIRVEAESR